MPRKPRSHEATKPRRVAWPHPSCHSEGAPRPKNLAGRLAWPHLRGHVGRRLHAQAFDEHAHADVGTAPVRPAFSLAELMIAIVILGLGLLFIAAALPVGLSYTRDTLDLAAGEAASEYALDTVEQCLRTSHNLVKPIIFPPQPRLDNLFRPRQNIGPNYPLAPRDPEPWIKVRPLVMTNVVYGPTGGPPSKGDEITYDTENATIAPWFPFAGVNILLGLEKTQYDAVAGRLRLGTYPMFFPAFPGFPGLPSVARVYPPITPDWPFTTTNFFVDLADGVLTPRPVLTPTLGGSETLKALERRVVWTAFYRRLLYPQPGPDGSFGTLDDIAGDPLLYEVIVLVVRRPSVDHRFPIQDNSAGNPAQPLAATVAGSEVLAPEPWLVTFDPNWSLPPQPPLVVGTDYANTPDRPLLPAFSERPTLTFRCTREVGILLPVGSIFIPAVNDDWPRRTAALRRAGFVPHAPDALPIYEVVERPDEFTVIVKNNGFYPWIDIATGQTPANWPVWVIPPAFRERDSTGQPVYERRSPILAIARRYIRLREID